MHLVVKMPLPTYNTQQEKRLKFISALYPYFRDIREVKFKSRRSLFDLHIADIATSEIHLHSSMRISITFSFTHSPIIRVFSGAQLT